MLLLPVLGIRGQIRICMFLGLPDPDPLVRDVDPAQDTDPSLFIKVLSGLKYCLQNKILTQNFSQTLNF
jgi:hypothetical protein